MPPLVRVEWPPSHANEDEARDRVAIDGAITRIS